MMNGHLYVYIRTDFGRFDRFGWFNWFNDFEISSLEKFKTPFKAELYNPVLKDPALIIRIFMISKT